MCNKQTCTGWPPPKAGGRLWGKTGQVKNRQDKETTRSYISQERALAHPLCGEGKMGKAEDESEWSRVLK